jgi:DNA polymerase (family 10)
MQIKMRKELIEILENIAKLLEIKGENPFKSNAYVNAAAILETEDIDLEKAVAEDTLGDIKGFGKALQEKITDFVKNGKMAYYEKLKTEVPVELIELTKIEGVGNKKAGQLWRELEILTIDELEQAARDGKISELKGFSSNTEKKIIESVARYREAKDLMYTNKEFKNIR